MILARKLRSAVSLYRRKGLSDVAELARLRSVALYLAHRPVPARPDRRARMLAGVLNRWSGLSPLTIGPGEVAQVRDALALPYIRIRFAEAAEAAARLPDLRPLEVAILADCLMSLWDYARVDAALPTWTAAVAGTAYAHRIAQTARWTALRLGRLGEAERGLDDLGDDVAASLLRGEIYDALGRLEEAERAYEAAVRRSGSDASVRRSYGFHLMKAGRLLDGLASWGVADTLSNDYPLRRHRPQWTGEALGTRCLLIIFEHGLGDMIQMARFLPRLLAREPDATVLASVPAPLAGLLGRAFPGVTFVSADEREPDYDLFVPSMHLAAVLDAADLEPRTRYIDLGAPATARGARPRVGVCWRGHPRQYEATRSIPIAVFARLFDAAGVDFVVLLNRLTPEEADSLRDIGNVEVPPIRDFIDLAGVVASCDHVVSVDTAVVHLAGAGGKPVVLLSRPDGCWRWGVSGMEAPWYDTVEVLRHAGDMDWPRLLAEAAERIEARCLSPAMADA